MGHIHAELMAQYAEDAKQHDRPWELWQHGDHEGWVGCTTHPSWHKDHSYRRKPQTIMLGEYEVPEPCRTPLKDGEVYWIISIVGGSTSSLWQGDVIDFGCLENGFIHLTRDAAEKHFNALKSFTAKGDQ